MLGSLPTSLALPPLGLLLLACVVASLGARVAQTAGTEGLETFAPFAIAMVIAGVASSLISIVQVYWPDLPDGQVIARSGLPGRAVGNLRQPNHLASLLIWGVIALVPLVEWRRIPRWLGAAIGALLMFGVVLSGSRTGLYLGTAVLAAWAAADNRLSTWTRVALFATLFVAAGVYGWGWLSQHGLGGGRLVGAAARASEGDTGHVAIWRNMSLACREELR